MIAEPLVTRQLWKSELARVALGAVRSSLSMIYDITSTSFDRMYYHAREASRSDQQSPYYLHSVHILGLFARGFSASSSMHPSPRGTRYRPKFFAPRLRCSGKLIYNDMLNSPRRMALQQYGERYPAGLRHMQMVDDLLAFTSNGEGFAASYMYE